MEGADQDPGSEPESAVGGESQRPERDTAKAEADPEFVIQLEPSSEDDTDPEAETAEDGSEGTYSSSAAESEVRTKRRCTGRTREGVSAHLSACSAVAAASQGHSRQQQPRKVKRPFVCCECDARFSTRGDLKRHKRVHSGEKPFSCGDCGVNFSRQGNLKVHRVRRHSSDKPFLCQSCDAEFGSNRELKQHSKIQTVGRSSEAPGL